MRPRVLLVDNYDSFTYNLVQLIGSLGAEILVYRNDTELSTLVHTAPTHLVISPGPGNASDAGVSLQALEHFQGKIPILGVCLGLQVIGSFYGAQLVCAQEPVHGRSFEIQHKGVGVFAGLPHPTPMARYHSLVLSEEGWPHESLEITAWTQKGEIMGLRHKHLCAVEGVQFHPESFMSPYGPQLMRNFLHAKVPSP